MEPLSVLVSGVGGGGHGEQILKALRLAKTNYKIIGTDVAPLAKGLMEVDYAYIVPPAHDPSYIETILKICKKHQVSALFHGSEPELKAMNTHRDELEKHGLFLPINPSPVIELGMDKVKASDFLRAHGFHVPAYRRIKTLQDLEEFDNLPAVLKPSVGGGGSANVFLAQTRRELMYFAPYLLSLYPEFMVQEYVGTPDSEFTVGVLVSMDGELLNSIAVKRNILAGLSNRIKVPNFSGRADLGRMLALSNGISQGEIGHFHEVTEPCERIAMSMGCRGVLNLQCRLLDAGVYVFEVNPRFSGTTSLRAMVGYNEPDVLIRKHLLGEYILPRFPYRSGIIARGLAEVLMESPDFPIGADL